MFPDIPNYHVVCGNTLLCTCMPNVNGRGKGSRLLYNRHTNRTSNEALDIKNHNFILDHIYVIAHGIHIDE